MRSRRLWLGWLGNNYPIVNFTEPRSLIPPERPVRSAKKPRRQRFNISMTSCVYHKLGTVIDVLLGQDQCARSSLWWTPNKCEPITAGHTHKFQAVFFRPVFH